MTAVIFDLNGVFIKSPPLSVRFEKDFGVPAAEFLRVLDEVMTIVRRPGAPDTFSLFEPHLARWSVALGREAFYQYWFLAEKPDLEMVAFARELRSRGILIFALSNNFRERVEYYHATFPFMADLFDGISYSWQTGTLKPDAACWTRLLQEHGLEPASVLYFDDSAKNVGAAAALGIRSYRFESLSQIRRLLA